MFCMNYALSHVKPDTARSRSAHNILSYQDSIVLEVPVNYGEFYIDKIICALVFRINFVLVSEQQKMWDVIDTDFGGDETVNFGPRKETGTALYQIDTIATVSCRDQVTL